MLSVAHRAGLWEGRHGGGQSRKLRRNDSESLITEFGPPVELDCAFRFNFRVGCCYLVHRPPSRTAVEGGPGTGSWVSSHKILTLQRTRIRNVLGRQNRCLRPEGNLKGRAGVLCHVCTIVTTSMGKSTRRPGICPAPSGVGGSKLAT